MIDGQNFFDNPIKNNLITYDNIWKTPTSQGDDYILLVYLSKQQALDADPKTLQHINCTANLDLDGKTTMLFIIEEVKETILDFSQGTVKVF